MHQKLQMSHGLVCWCKSNILVEGTAVIHSPLKVDSSWQFLRKEKEEAMDDVVKNPASRLW